MNNWISVEDELPDYYNLVMIYVGYDVTFGWLVKNNWHNWRYFSDSEVDMIWSNDVTHWQPLPEPPSEITK